MKRTTLRTQAGKLGPAILVAALLAGCSDGGKEVAGPPDDGEPPPDGDLPQLEELVPVRTVVQDTVRIAGAGFGEEQGEQKVWFAAGGGGRVEAAVVSWTDGEVVVLVPGGAISGDVTAERDGRMSNALAFDVAPSVVYFAADLTPIFQLRGCLSCHSGPGAQNGFSVESPQSVRQGGLRGPAVIPRRAQESLIIRKLRGTAPGDRMPQGAPEPIPEEEILTISDWINQGARDN